MRIQRLFIALCLGIMPVLVLAAPSGASENELPACVAELAEKYELVGPEGLNEEAIEEAKHKSDAFKTAADKCNQSPSPVMPALPELLWGGIAFLIVFIGLAKVGFPAIKKGLADREARIRADLDGAEQARMTAQSELAAYQTQLAEARKEASGILDEARLQAEAVRKELVAKAEADAQELRGKAADDIRLASERAMSDLTAKVSELSVQLAEKIVEKNIDPASQQQLVENFINQVGSN